VIQEISPEDTYPKDHPRIDVSDFYILPGLINLHTHCAMNFLKGYHKNTNDVVSDVFFETETQLDVQKVEDFSYSYLYDGLRSGVTSFNDHYFFSKGTQAAVSKMGVRGFCGETIMNDEGPFPYPSNISDSLLQTNQDPLIQPVLAPHASDTVNKETWTKLSELSKQTNTPLHFHLAQREHEKNVIQKKHQKSPVKFLHDLGVLGPNCIAVHLIHVDQEDQDILLKTKTHLVICPGSQILFESVSPLLEHLGDLNNMSIATDCAASNDSCDLLAELRLTASLYKQKTGEYICPKKLLKMVTMNPARALGVDSQIGSIEASKQADLVFIKKTPHLLPEERLVDHLIFSNASKDIEHVMVAGKPVLLNKLPVKISEEEITNKFTSAYENIKFPKQ